MTQIKYIPWLAGAGEMVERVRAKDWAQTPLGPINAWPQSLKTAVQMALAAPFPHIVLWGPDLLQIYNDACRDLMGGKHPAGLGQPTRDCWPEVWHINEPLYARARAGESVSFEDALYPIKRSGNREDVWFTLSYSPIRDESGMVAGVLVTVFETTKRLQAEAALTDSEERFRTLVQATSDIVYTMSADWSVLHQLLGKNLIDIAERPSRTWLETYIPDEERERVQAVIQEAIRSKSVFELEHRVFRDDGTVGWTFSRAIPRFDDAGEIVEWFGTATDITARKATEIAWRESEEKYRAIFNSINEGFSLLDVQFDDDGQAYDIIIRDANPAQDRIDGVRALIGRRVREFLPNIERKWIERYATIARTGVPQYFEDWSEANQRWYEVHAVRVGDPGSTLVAIVYSDVTERKHEEQRREFLLKLNDVLRPLSDPVAIQEAVSETARQYLRADRCYYCEIEGSNVIIRRDSSREDLPSVAGVYPLESLPLFRSAMQSAVPLVVSDANTTNVMDDELRQLCLHMQIVSFINVPIHKQGQYVGNLCLTQTTPREWPPVEVSLIEETAERTWAAVERARAEEALRESEARLRAIHALVPALLWRVDADGRNIAWNVRWGEYTGQTLEQSKNGRWLDAIHPDDQPNTERIFRDAFGSGDEIEVEHRIRRHDGVFRWFLVRQAPLYDDRGAILRWFGAAIDVQELHELRESLEAKVAERTEELTRTLAALEEAYAERRELVRRVVSAQEQERRRISRELHDQMGQHIAALGIGLSALEPSLQPESGAMGLSLRQIVEEMAREVHRLAVELRPTALDDLGLVPALSSYVAEWSDRLGIDADFDAIGLGAERLPPDTETAIYRVVQEALTNIARHAVPQGATRAAVILQQDGVIQVTVEDDGPGFDLGTASLAGRLGIAGMRERAELVGGSLEIESSPGAGTTVYLRVPLVPAPPLFTDMPT